MFLFLPRISVPFASDKDLDHMSQSRLGVLQNYYSWRETDQGLVLNLKSGVPKIEGLG